MSTTIIIVVIITIIIIVIIAGVRLGREILVAGGVEELVARLPDLPGTTTIISIIITSL